jgi:FKBP-type peptidyl-prolyl cis-trans isomerase (trigger factor)
LKGQKKTVEQLKAEWRPQAERNVRMELGLSEVARLEGVAIADNELQAEIDKIQDNRVKQQFTQQEPRMHLRHALRQTKTLNLLKTIVK